MTEHVSQCFFAVRGRSIAVWTDDGWLDLVKQRGQSELKLYTLGDIYQPFQTKAGSAAVDLRRPHLEGDARRVGGWPVLEGTRIAYDTVATAIGNVTIFPADVARLSPGVTEASALDVVSFDDEVRSRTGKAA